MQIVRFLRRNLLPAVLLLLSLLSSSSSMGKMSVYGEEPNPATQTSANYQMNILCNHVFSRCTRVGICRFQSRLDIISGSHNFVFWRKVVGHATGYRLISPYQQTQGTPTRHPCSPRAARYNPSRKIAGWSSVQDQSGLRRDVRWI